MEGLYKELDELRGELEEQRLKSENE